eukprot:SAG31_NODE_67_length_28318_cov_6.493674_26_plen_64_part_00
MHLPRVDTMSTIIPRVDTMSTGTVHKTETVPISTKFGSLATAMTRVQCMTQLYITNLVPYSEY